MSAPQSSEQTRTIKAFFATLQASSRRSSGAAPCVKARNTSAVPGGLTTGKIAASTRRNVLTPCATWMRSPRCDLLCANSARAPGLALNFGLGCRAPTAPGDRSPDEKHNDCADYRADKPGALAGLI